MLKTALSATVGCLVGAGMVVFGRAPSLRLNPIGMSYSDLAATLLAAVSVLLAVLGLFIAVLAVLGWSQFRGLARKAAVDTAREHIDQRLASGDLRQQFEHMATEYLKVEFVSGNLRKLIEERVDYVIYGGEEGRSSPDAGVNENEE